MSFPLNTCKKTRNKRIIVKTSNFDTLFLFTWWKPQENNMLTCTTKDLSFFLFFFFFKQYFIPAFFANKFLVLSHLFFRFFFLFELITLTWHPYLDAYRKHNLIQIIWKQLTEMNSNQVPFRPLVKKSILLSSSRFLTTGKKKV